MYQGSPSIRYIYRTWPTKYGSSSGTVLPISTSRMLIKARRKYYRTTNIVDREIHNRQSFIRRSASLPRKTNSLTPIDCSIPHTAILPSPKGPLSPRLKEQNIDVTLDVAVSRPIFPCSPSLRQRPHPSLRGDARRESKNPRLRLD